MSKYNYHMAVHRLEQRGLKAVRDTNGKVQYFKASKDVRLGVKSWAYLDFLKTRVVRIT